MGKYKFTHDSSDEIELNEEHIGAVLSNTLDERVTLVDENDNVVSTFEPEEGERGPSPKPTKKLSWVWPCVVSGILPLLTLAAVSYKKNSFKIRNEGKIETHHFVEVLGLELPTYEIQTTPAPDRSVYENIIVDADGRAYDAVTGEIIFRKNLIEFPASQSVEK